LVERERNLMKGLTIFVGVVAAALFLIAAGTPASAIKLNIIIGPADVGGGLYGPARRCRWVKQRGACYKERVCVKRKKNGRCKVFERRRVCEERDVRVCG
jgi:hypothetical protein